jgi:hypothetical protein
MVIARPPDEPAVGGQQQRVLIAARRWQAGLTCWCSTGRRQVSISHQRPCRSPTRIHNGTSTSSSARGRPVRGIIDRAVVLREGRVIHDGPLGQLGEHHQGRHEQEGPSIDAGWLGGALEP